MSFLGVFRAIYDYAPQTDEELEIKEGDLLFVLEKSSDDDWWRAKKKAASDDDEEPEGLIPNNYVEQAKVVHQARALYDYTKQTDEELSFKEDSRLDVYDVTDPDWTLVGSNGEYGFAPAIYIEISDSHATASEPEAPAMPPRPTAQADNGAIPGEADYVPPGQSSGANPAAALAGIIAQRTGGTDPGPAPQSAAPRQRTLAAPPPIMPIRSQAEEAPPAMPTRPQYTPEESEEDEPAAPNLPQRPASQSIPEPPTPPKPEPVRTSHNNTSRVVSNGRREDKELPYSPGAFRLYNIYEMVSHMGKNKKMPTTLGINLAKGVISITPEQRNDGPAFEWTAEKLTHYSIEGKHVFVELIRPSKSVDFHAGAKDTAKEIVALLGELAGAVRQEGLREVLAASAGTGAGALRSGTMLYEFMAQSPDEVTVAVGDEVVVLEQSNEEWWKIRRLRNGKEGVVPSSYVDITGSFDRGPESITGLNAARSTVEQNRLEEKRLAREAAKGSKKRPEDSIPERDSSLNTDSKKNSRDSRSAKDGPKTKPNSSRVRTWTDRSGTFKVDAEFIGLRDGKIHLHKLNGVKIAVPVAKMAVEDLEYVERATGQSLDEDKPLSDIKRRSTMKAKGQNGGMAGASVQKKDEYDWFDFFLQCGVSPQICERYASSFSKDQMSPEILPEVNESLLRTLGLKEGDILRVVKFLDAKYDRKKLPAEPSSSANGSLFTDASGALRNNTRKGRPAPPVETNDTIDDNALKSKDLDRLGGASPATTTPSSAQRGGFDDDAWDVKPTRSQPAPMAAVPVPAIEPPKPRVNEDLLSLASPPLQPQVAPVAQTVPAAATSPVQTQPQGADQAVFDKIAALVPQTTAAPRQRPTAPTQQGAANNLAPPPRAASAPGFNPQQNLAMAAPLQAHLTGYGQPLAPPGQSLQDLQTLQSMQRLQQAGLLPQATAMNVQPTGYQQQQQPQFPQPPPQPTGIQAMQQNFPAMQPQQTGFVPQSQFGQAYTGQMSTQQALMNGAVTGSPFADPMPRPYAPQQPSGLANSFIAQPTGFPPQNPGFGVMQPTGINGFGSQPTNGPPPQLPPQQMGGVFGPSQPLTPLVPQKTGPPPPVRFGVQGAKPMVPQRTGRAELSRATPQNPFGF